MAADGLSFDVNTDSFAKFASSLRKASPLLASKMTKEFKVAGEIVAAQVRANASFSSRIPATVKVRSAGGRIRIVAGAGLNGEAQALEHGGKGGTFRHPVFGNADVWVSQKARPFLRPAVMAHRKAATDAALRALHSAMKEAGLR